MTDDSNNFWHDRYIQLSDELDRERSRSNDLERTISAIRSERLWMLPFIIIVMLFGSGHESWTSKISDAVVHGSAMTAWLIWLESVVTSIYRKFHRDD